MIEKIEKLKEKITKIQGIMIAVSTGRGNIDDSEEEYRNLYFSIKEQLKSFRKKGVQFPDLNFFFVSLGFLFLLESRTKNIPRKKRIRSIIV